MDETSARNDKRRNNLLEREGWSVLRFTNKDIDNDLNGSINIVMETANKYGGIQDAQNPKLFSYLNKEEGQMKIFK